jgi:transcriptional regulator with XRE-family HTH domain
MTFRELVMQISKTNNISRDKVEFEIAENLKRSVATIRGWENNLSIPSIELADKLYKLIKKLYKLDVNIYEIFVNTKKQYEKNT